MTSNRFSIRQSDIDSSSVFIHGDEHHHLSNVARIRPKEKVWLFDEQGTRYLARVEEVTKEGTRLTILEKEGTSEPGVKIILAQAIIKSKRMNSILLSNNKIWSKKSKTIDLIKHQRKIKEFLR